MSALLEQIANHAELDPALKQELTPREALDLESAGDEYMKAHKFTLAENYFARLAVIDPYEKRLWVKLARARQASCAFEKATKAWAIAALLDPNDSAVHLAAAECFMSLEKTSDALRALDLAKKSTICTIADERKIKLLRERL